MSVQRPLRFVGVVLALWVGARAAVLLPDGDRIVRMPPPPARQAVRVAESPAVTPAPPEVAMTHPSSARPDGQAPMQRRAGPPSATPATALPAVTWSAAPDRRPPPAPRPMLAGVLPPPLPPPAGPGSSRLTGDAYLFLREGSGVDPLSPGGQLGGGQVFARLEYALGVPGLAATLRGSRAIGAPGGEVALGLRWAPARAVRLVVERRAALDRGGRDAWAAFVAGGLDDRRVGPLRLDGYAQAGMVGLERRDGFVDGALRVGRPLGRATVGAGVWGAAQPGVSRLDVGPHIAWRAPVGKVGATASLDWRIRVAGDARPGTGLALTLAAGF